MYVFIAYKPDSTETSRGCRMGSYSSDHAVHIVDRKGLVNIWAQYLQKNLNLDCQETEYEFWVFKDGVMVFEERCITWDDGTYRDVNDTDEIIIEAEKAEINDVYKEASILAAKNDKTEKSQKALESQKAAQATLEKSRQARLEQFKTLKKEFESVKSDSIENFRKV